MNARQAAFVREYLVDLNATQAAIRAGYSTRTAKQQGSRLLTNADVAQAVAAAKGERAERVEVTQDRVLQELARIAFADIRSLFTWDEERACYVPSADLTDDEAAVVSGVKAKTTHFTSEGGDTTTRIELELKTYDKVGALEKLAKHLGMFVDRHEVTGKDGGPIEVRTVRFPAVASTPEEWAALNRGAVPTSNGAGKNGASGHGK